MLSVQDALQRIVQRHVALPPETVSIADAAGRVLAEMLAENLGQPFVVDNRPGAAGQLGLTLGARAPADGYTVIGGQGGNMAVQPHTYRKLPYDPLKDFVPVALSTTNYLALVVSPSAPFKNVQEMIAYAKTNKGKLSFASNGAGGFPHMSMEMLRVAAGLFDYTHVPYKGNVPAITDLISGQTSMLFATLPTVLPHVQSKRLKGIAVLGAKRSSALPDMPTLAESGLRGFEVTNWTGLLAPAGTPAAIVSRLNAETLRVMQLPEVQARLPKEGLRFVAMTTQQFGDFVKSEKEKWAPIVKATGAKAD